MTPLKYLSNIWRALEMPSINWEINLHFKWSKNCILVTGAEANQNPMFQINETLSTQKKYKTP